MNTKSAQTLTNLKTAQTAFKNLHTSTKSAMDDPAMGMSDKDQMIEQIFQQAEQLVDTAITAVETVGGEGGANEIGADPGVLSQEGAPTDIGGVPGVIPPKENTAMGDHPDDDPLKVAMQKMAQELDETKKEVDDMKNKEAQMKLAQKYSDLFPIAMKNAKFEEFMGHSEGTAILTARLDEATVMMSQSNVQKFAQQEDSVFRFEDLEHSPNNTLSPGGKL